MPKQDNNNGRASNGQQSRSTSRRQQPKGDLRRENLLEKILEESSSISLNDPSSQINAKQILDNHSRLFELIEELRDLESSINPELPQRNESAWARFIEWIDKEISCCKSNTQGPASTDKTAVGKESDHGRLFDRVGIKTSQQLQSSTELADAAAAAGDANSLQSANIECSLVAKVPFKEGDEVFRIPRRVMLTTETAIQDLDLLDFVKKDSIASGMQNVVLVLHLLNEFSKRDQSYWWPYLSILPNKLLPILTMSKNSFTNYLACSSHLNEALKMLRAIVRQYCYFYKRLQSTRLPIRKSFTFEYYSWGVSMVCSRNNEVPSKNRHQRGDERHEDYEKATCLSSSSIQALVPILDMCNHDSRSHQAVFDNDASCLTSRRDLLPNQEITINYGNRSSGEFYIHNGFVPQESLAHAVVPLTVSLKHKQDLQLPLRAKLLKILNMPTTFGHFKLNSNVYENRHKRDPHLTMFLIVYLLNSEELEFILDAENPVGVADEIYEHVQYKSNELNKSSSALEIEDGLENGTESAGGNKETEFVNKMKRRLDKSLKEYLSRRASISIALIDRTLKELSESGKECDKAEANYDHDKLYLIRLLQHEKRIYESYVLKENIEC